MSIINLIFLFLLTSCGMDDFRDKSKLEGLRVLALTANTPEINSASTVTVTPLISYINGSGASLDYSWEACPDPGVDFGADFNCDDSLSALKLSGSGTFNTSTLSASFFTGNSTDISLVIPAAVFTYLGTLNSDIQFNGLDYILFVKFLDSSKDISTSAFKKIKLSTKASGNLNTNPTFSGVQFNGNALTSYPSNKGTISISTASNPQSYSLVSSSGTKVFEEDMFFSWYSSDGKYLFDRTDVGENNDFTPDGGSGVFVIVYRDSRGGVATSTLSL